MFRPVSDGDWAADDDDEPKPTTSAPTNAWQQGPPPELGVKPVPQAPPERERERDRDGPDGFVRGEREPLRGRWARPQADDRDRDRDRDRGFDRGFNREREFERERGGFERERERDRGFDRDRGFERERDRDFDRERGGFERERGFDRRDRGRDRGFDRPPREELPVERGTVVSLRENFGFISCVDREGDLFFHISEAPVDVQLQDEVEFRVRFNQRSEKDIAVQLVKLPAGSIVWEDIAEEFVEGTITKGIPRSSFHGSGGFGGSAREEPHGLIQVKAVTAPEPEPNADAKENEAPDAASAEAPTTGEAEQKPEKTEETKPSRPHHAHVRFSAESCAQEEEQGSRGPRIPRLGDDVRFRIATHRRSGIKRAVELTITNSARDKMNRKIDEQLDSMTREQGVVQRLASGGGFIKCCSRMDDVYFPFHELRKGVDDTTKPDKAEKPTIREGDEVSFFVYEDRNATSRSSRLTALRVVVLPPGSVCFQELLRESVEGVVTKAPRESRNGPEILGMIHPNSTAPAKETTKANEEVKDTTGTKGAEAKASKSGKKLKKTEVVGFHLSDISDTTYVAAVGDTVVFDEVLDKRSGRNRAANVRLVRFNPEHREQGVISAMKDEFGFIKCADRAGDAYFRFGDVMSLHKDFRNGTEVAFDVNVDPIKGGDSIRATRIEILPSGTLQWESVLEPEAEGEIVAVPSRGQSQRGSFGGRGGKQVLQRHHNGRVCVTLSTAKHLVDFFPEFKAKVDETFVSDTPEPDVEGEDEPRAVFPSSLSKYERAAIHEYCDWLGVSHESSGDGPSRHLEVFSKQKVVRSMLPPAAAATTTVEFHSDDLADVRYNPHVGDHVKVKVVLLKRSKQVLAKDVVLVSAAAPKGKAAAAAASSPDASRKDSHYSSLPKAEGVIITIKPEGFGFIKPADQTGDQENLFFHVKEILTGQGPHELKPGMEAQFHVSYDDKRKKSRAVGISIVPDGTIKKVEATPLRGVVVRASLLRRLRPMKGNNRAGKNDQPNSYPGRIRVTQEAEADGKEEETEAADVAASTGEADKAKPKPSKTSKKETFTYFINDIADQTLVVREGDEIEFIPQSSVKGPRATKIRVLRSHAKQGVVKQVFDGSHGIIQVDPEEGDTDAAPVEVSYVARNVLRGDMLKEGDRVEFAISTRPQEKQIKSSDKKDEEKEDHDQEQEQHSDGEGEDQEEEETDKATGESKTRTRQSSNVEMMLIATSVLCLEPGNGRKASQQPRPENRSVNATLRQAMRQVGASASAESRMAKGPDGTKGFKAGWRPAAVAPASTASVTVTTKSSTETVVEVEAVTETEVVVETVETEVSTEASQA